MNAKIRVIVYMTALFITDLHLRVCNYRKLRFGIDKSMSLCNTVSVLIELHKMRTGKYIERLIYGFINDFLSFK